MERIYNKLVRDNIPNIIKKNNETPITRVLNEDEYKKELELKLYEEYKEIIETKGNERLEELADMIEVIKALASLEIKKLKDIIDIADEKASKRGSFSNRIFLEKVIESE